MQRANGKYKGHLVGQLTSSHVPRRSIDISTYCNMQFLLHSCTCHKISGFLGDFLLYFTKALVNSISARISRRERPKGAKDKVKRPKGLQLEVGPRRDSRLLEFYKAVRIRIARKGKQFIRQTLSEWASCGIPRSLPLAAIKHPQRQQQSALH